MSTPMSRKNFRRWTEGSHLEPDVEHGMSYLDALRTVSARAR